MALGADPGFAGFQSAALPILQQHCIACHGPDEQNGGVNFAKVQDDVSLLRARKVWRKSLAQLEAGTMPPADEEALEPADRQQLIEWLRAALAAVDAHPSATSDPGPAIVRRLGLAEYNRTIRELLGFDFNAAELVGLPDDAGNGNSYGNLAAALEIPPALLDKYFAAADKALERFFGAELSSNVDGEIQERAMMSRELLFGLKPGSWRNPETPIQPAAGLPPREAARQILLDFVRRAYRRPPTDAEIERLLRLYDRAAARDESFVSAVRLTLKGALVSPYFLFRVEGLPNGENPAVSPTDDKAARSAAISTDATAPPAVRRVSDHELAVRLSYFLWSGPPDAPLAELADGKKLTADGPSTSPTRLSGTLSGATPNDKDHGWEKAADGDTATFFESQESTGGWLAIDLGQPRTIRQIRFAARYGQEHRTKGGKFVGSDKADFSSADSSNAAQQLAALDEAPAPGWQRLDIAASNPVRYVRYESPKDAHTNIAEFEVWGPDDGTTLEQQVRRMLVDPRARALTDNFAARWLEITKLSMARPSMEFFPEFTADVRQAMYEETALFFDHLRSDDRSVLELLDADYTYLNEALAKHYGIPDVAGKEMRRVKLEPQYHRGGLLGMGSMLALTSHTSRTSPTLRGKWILDVIFGTPPPPPPANAGVLEENDKGQQPKSFREKMALHAGQASCAACHKKMDPLGFALENFNAVGVWRDDDKGGRLDTSGVLPNGEKFNGMIELRRAILVRRQEFVRNLIEQMLTYALGRELDYYDDGVIQQIQERLERADYRFSALILAIVESYPFQYRRSGE